MRDPFGTGIFNLHGLGVPSVGEIVQNQDLVPENQVITVSDVRLDLLTKSRTASVPPSSKIAWSTSDIEDFLIQSGWAHRKSEGAEIVIPPETLLVFGTESALNAYFPHLKTAFVRRDIERGHSEEFDLPLNLVDLHASLMEIVSVSMPPIQGGSSKEIRNHASIRDKVFACWFLEMVLFRDYSQAKPARFVQDRQYLFLEYPRVLTGLMNSSLESMLKAVSLTMQAWGSESPSQAENAYFSMTPVRVNGRFFKIMAATPPDSPLIIDPYHASLSHPAIVTEVADRAGSDQKLRHPRPFNPGSPALLVPRKPKVESGPSTPSPAPSVSTAPASLPRAIGPSDRTIRILTFCSSPRQREEIQRFVGMNNRDHFRKEVLNRLIDQGLIAPTLPDKPNSPKQRYVTVTPAS